MVCARFWLPKKQNSLWNMVLEEGTVELLSLLRLCESLTPHTHTPPCTLPPAGSWIQSSMTATAGKGLQMSGAGLGQQSNLAK